MSDSPQFGVRCAAALKEAKRANANLGWQEIAAIIQAQHDSINDLTLTPEEPKPRVSKKDLNGALFDALCAACGTTTKEMTGRARGRVGKALSEIRSVAPDVTPEEIVRRGKLYKQRHRDWPLTPTALSGHWHELGGGDKTATAKRDIYQDLPNWKDIAAQLWPTAELPENWFDLSPALRADVLRKIA